MSSVLVIDDMAIFREPIAASLRLVGHTTFSAKDGSDGLQQLRTHLPDLVLLDVEMPKLDGMSVVRAMRQEPGLTNIPIILLTSHADKKFVLEAAKLGVRDYLLKAGFSLTELHERIKRVLAVKSGLVAAPVSGPGTPQQNRETATPGAVPGTSGVRAASEPFIPENLTPLLNSEQCISRIEACMAGKTLSGAVADVLMLAGLPSADLKDLSALITRDPLLSARVLQMANSAAFFTRRGSVTTISDAVRNIGASNVRNIAASVGIFDAMPASSSDGFNPIRCWQHSFAVARLCESFVLPTAPAEAGVAYLVGLCHDLGELMFRIEFEQEYKLVLDVQQRTGAALEDIEQRLLGMTHSDILRVILKCMGLPESIRNPIERLQTNSKTATGQPLVSRALAIAESYANGLLLASSESSLITPVTAKDWTALSGQSTLAIPDGKEIRSQVYCLTAILSRMNSAEQTLLIKSPHQKGTAVIWLARDKLFSDADPFAAALGEFATVEVHDRLPTPDQASGLSALAIEGRGRNRPGWSLPEIENSRKENTPLPVLWLTNESAEPPSNLAMEPIQAVSLRAIQVFIERIVPAPLRPAA